MATSLWQAAPYATAVEIKQAIELSSSLYDDPDSLLGYGIPDFRMAWLYLINQTSPLQEIENQWKVYPNPVENYLILSQDYTKNYGEVEIEIYSMEGRLLKQWRERNAAKIYLTGLHSLPPGILLLKVNSDKTSETIKIFKPGN